MGGKNRAVSFVPDYIAWDAGMACPSWSASVGEFLGVPHYNYNGPQNPILSIKAPSSSAAVVLIDE